MTDLASGRCKTSVSIPIGMVDVGLRMGARFTPEMADVDISELLAAIKSGVDGKMIDVEDVDKGEHIEVSVD